MSNPLINQLDEAEEKFLYEGKIAYRLIKVLYYFALIVSIVFALLIMSSSLQDGIIIIAVAYVVLNLIKEALLYIFVGRPFRWKWLE